MQDERPSEQFPTAGGEPAPPPRRKFRRGEGTNRVARDAGTLMTGDLVDRALGMVYLVVATKFYGLEIYGAYQLALAIFQVVRTIVSFGLGRGLVKDTAAAIANNERGRVKGSILLGFAVSASAAVIASGVLVFLGAPLIDLVYPNHPEAATPLRMFGLLTPIFAVNFVILQVFYGLGRFKLLVFTNNVVEPAARLASLVVLVIAGVPGLIAIPLAYLAALIFSTIAALIPFRKIWLKFSDARAEFHTRETLTYVVPVMLNDLFTRSFRSVNIFLLALLLTTEEIGIFSIALKLTAIVFFFSGSLGAAYRPRIAALIAERKQEQLSGELKAMNRWVLTFATYFCGMLIVFPELVLGTIGAQFLPVAGAVRVLCAGLLVAQAAGSLMAILQMSGHSRPPLYFIVTASACYLGTAFALAPRFGVLGAAMAVTGTILILIPTLAAFVQWKVNVSLYSFTMWKPLVAGVAAFGVGYLVSRIMPAIRFVDLAVVATSVLGVYVALLVLFRVETEERELLFVLLSPIKKIAKKLGLF